MNRPSLKDPSNILLFALLMVVLASLPTQAVDGRDFAGFYQISSVAPNAATVRLTLTVRAFNYSDGEAADATLTLQNFLDLAQDHGAFPGPVTIADRAHALLSAEFTISTEEYDRWQNGGAPSIRIDYRDPNGNSQRRTVEVTPAAVEVE